MALVPYPHRPPAALGRYAGSISRKLAVMLFAILLLAVANVVLVRGMLNELNGVAETVNVAGKLRMLSQKTAFEAARLLPAAPAIATSMVADASNGQHVEPATNAALATASSAASLTSATAPTAIATDEALETALSDVERALRVLAEGGQAFGFDVPAIPAAQQPALGALQRDWETYRQRIGEARAAPDEALRQQAQVQIAQAAEKLLADSEVLVAGLTHNAQHAQQRALMQVYGVLVLNAVLLALIFLAARRRIVRPLLALAERSRVLAERSRELAEGRIPERLELASGDEVGFLADSFDEAVQRIGALMARIEQDRRKHVQAEAMFRGFAENSVVGVYIVQDGRFRFVNRKMAQMFGYETEEMVQSVKVLDLVPDSDRPAVEENIRRRIDGELSEVRYERRARRKDGSLFDVEVFGSLMALDGTVATIGIMHDVSERKRLDLALRVLSACNQALVRATDEKALLSDVCRIVRDISGYPFVWVGLAEDDGARTVRPGAVAEVAPGAMNDIIDQVSWADTSLGRGVTGCAIRRGETVVLKDVQTNAVIAPWRDFMARHHIVAAMSLPLRGGQRVLGALTVYSYDDSAFGPQEVRIAEELADNLAYGIAALRAEHARRDYARQLEYHARHDILTGLANRALLHERLSQAIAVAARASSSIWVVFIDLDRFKMVNDSLGHKAGDNVLLSVAQRLELAVRESDTVARLGGDEFVIVLPEQMGEHLAGNVVNRIMEAIAAPIEVDGHSFVLGCSAGVAVYPSDGSDAETLIRNADIAMYRAKESGRNNFQFYTAAMNDRLLERLRLEADLRLALERDELVLHYQPQIDLGTGRVVGAEALLRWQHPQLGMVSPLRFIALAEETGLIVPIGDWVLRQACLQARRWQQDGLGELRVAVNLSARQFAQPGLSQRVAAVLQETGLQPSLLELELTESLVMSDIERAATTLDELRALGVLLSLDDFGTGHSSLAYLKRLPINTLKIDQSFVRDIVTTPEDAAIVASIISLAQNLRRGVIAEGVETTEQLSFLHRQGCSQMQGFYFSKPVPPEKFARLLQEDVWPGQETVAADTSYSI